MEGQLPTDGGAAATDASVEVDPSIPSNSQASQLEELSHSTADALAKLLSSMISSLVKDFDSKAQSTLSSQDQLSSAIDRLTRELDQLLEDAPLPFMMHHAAKISNVRKRVSSLNLVLKSIQKRIDNIEGMLSVGVVYTRRLPQKAPEKIGVFILPVFQSAIDSLM